MLVKISDDFDIEKIIDSGQCFRPCRVDFKDDTFRFITGKNVLYISKTSDPVMYDVSCDEDIWRDVWVPYFDLENDYSHLMNSAKGDVYMQECICASRGIRILRQDKFEMLISFIISQRKSIPAIRSSIEKLCLNFGERIKTEYEEIYLFPQSRVLSAADMDILATCGLGYRLPYIIEASKYVNSENDLLEKLELLDDTTLFSKLIGLKGVGTKVANCVMLFAYHRTKRAPVDVWIARVIEEQYKGINPFDAYGNEAGIMQQFVFYRRRLFE